MSKAELRERFDKVYKTDDDQADGVTELIVDLFNYMSSTQLEEFYEYVLDEKGLTDKEVKNMY